MDWALQQLECISQKLWWLCLLSRVSQWVSSRDSWDRLDGRWFHWQSGDCGGMKKSFPKLRFVELCFMSLHHVCAATSHPAEEAARASDKRKWGHRRQKGEHRPAQGGCGPRPTQTEHRGRAPALHQIPALQVPGSTKGTRRGLHTPVEVGMGFLHVCVLSIWWSLSTRSESCRRTRSAWRTDLCRRGCSYQNGCPRATCWTLRWWTSGTPKTGYESPPRYNPPATFTKGLPKKKMVLFSPDRRSQQVHLQLCRARLQQATNLQVSVSIWSFHDRELTKNKATSGVF